MADEKSTEVCTTNSSINWNVRVKSKQFWLGIVGALGTCVMVALNAIGMEVDVQPWVDALNTIITGIFTILALIGVVNDPTTAGLADSAQAMTYTQPKPKTQCESTCESEADKSA